MAEYIKLWLAKIVAELALGLVLLAAVLIVVLVWAFFTWLKQARCPHSTYREDRSCQAWCQKCGKHLGFIGTVRKQRKDANG